MYNKNMPVKITNKTPSSCSMNDADFAIYIDFDKMSHKPQRVFQTASALITAFEKLDKSLCESISSNIKPILMLEEIETGSLKIWLKNKLETIDDDAIKELDWKKLVGSYLVKAKYACISWMNKDEKNKDSLVALSQDIRQIAQDTDIHYLPYYKAPAINDLVSGIQEISNAKDYLDKNDKLKFVSQETAIDFELSISWTPDKFTEFLTKEIIKYSDIPMILTVKKPDYLANSMWELRHGKKTIFAKIEHSSWLKDFQERKIDVRPGDALKCLVEQEFSYGYDNELVGEKYLITNVEKVLENQYKQLDLL